MTDTEIGEAIFKLRRARGDKILEVMKDYDIVMRQRIKDLQDQCSHSQTKSYYNYIGASCGKECVFCGKVTMDEE